MSDGGGLREIVFVVCAAFIVLAPAHRQVFGGEHPLPRWEMFSGTALDLYEVKLEAPGDDGARHPIDRFKVLGYDDPRTAPSNVRLLTRESDVRSLADRVCARLGPNAEVYMRVRDATKHGWHTVNDGQTNVCKPASPP
jgi:hypothetical protein